MATSGTGTYGGSATATTPGAGGTPSGNAGTIDNGGNGGSTSSSSGAGGGGGGSGQDNGNYGGGGGAASGYTGGGGGGGVLNYISALVHNARTGAYSSKYGFLNYGKGGGGGAGGPPGFYKVANNGFTQTPQAGGSGQAGNNGAASVRFYTANPTWNGSEPAA